MKLDRRSDLTHGAHLRACAARPTLCARLRGSRGLWSLVAPQPLDLLKFVQNHPEVSLVALRQFLEHIERVDEPLPLSGHWGVAKGHLGDRHERAARRLRYFKAQLKALPCLNEEIGPLSSKHGGGGGRQSRDHVLNGGRGPQVHVHNGGPGRDECVAHRDKHRCFSHAA